MNATTYTNAVPNLLLVFHHVHVCRDDLFVQQYLTGLVLHTYNIHMKHFNTLQNVTT